MPAAGNGIEHGGAHHRLGEPFDLEPLLVPHDRIGHVQRGDEIGIRVDLLVSEDGRRGPGQQERGDSKMNEHGNALPTGQLSTSCQARV